MMDMKRILKTMIFFGAMIVVLIGCSNSNESKLESFKQAVEENDAEALYELVKIDEDVYWSAKHAQDVIDNYNRTENNYNMQVEEFEEQLAAIEEGKPVNNEKNKFYFEEDGEIYLRGYEFYIRNSGLENADKITIKAKNIDDDFVLDGPFNDEKIVVAKLGPGNYEFQGIAKYGDEEIKSEATSEMNSADYQNFEKEIVISLSGQSAEVTTSIPETIVLSDGHKVDQIIDSGNVDMITKGVELQGVQKTSWGEIVSEPTTFENNDLPYDLTPHVFMDETDRQEIVRVIDNYYNQLYNALSENDKSILADAPATKDVIDFHDKDFNDIESNNLSSYFDGEVYKTTVDFSDVSVTEEGYLEVHADIYSNFQFFVTKYDESNKDEKVYQFKTVHLNKLDSGDWEIVKQEGSYRGSEEPNLEGEHLVDAK